jgi:PEP-CTERM motif
MKRWLLGLTAASLFILATGTAQAGSMGPSAVISSYDEGGKLIGQKVLEIKLDEGIYHIVDGLYEDSEGNSAMVSGTADPDPFIAFGLAVSDVGAASSFVFSLVIPVVPCPPGSILKADSSVSGSFTDGGSDGGSITPFGQPGVYQSFTALPVTVFSDLGGAAVFPPSTSSTYGPFAATVMIPEAGYTLLGVNIGFTGSGGGDFYTLTGRVTTTCLTVPEPSSLAMAGFAAFAGLGLLRRRMK